MTFRPVTLRLATLVATLALLAACKKHRTPAIQPAADTRDQAFADFIMDASQAAIAALRGQPHDPRWDGFDPMRDLRGSDPQGMANLALLGPQPEIVCAVVEVEALVSHLGGGAYLRSQVAVFPDRRLRWLMFRVRPERPYVSGVDGRLLQLTAPALSGEYNRMLEALANTCLLPMITPVDIVNFPPSVQADALRDAASQPMACSLYRNLQGQGTWQPRFDDFGVIVRGNNLYAIVRSGFDFTMGRPTLERATARTPTPN